MHSATPSSSPAGAGGLGPPSPHPVWDPQAVMVELRRHAATLGFSYIGVADVDLSSAEAGLLQWLSQGFHGEMHYMAQHGLKRARPAELVPGTVRVITARMDYLPSAISDGWQRIEWERLSQPAAAAVSLYARGRDYHKVMRSRLQKLAEHLAASVGPFGFRVFTDSAPVLEVELASRSGLGWRGKHTLLLSREAGSMFFLGEIYVDVALPLTPPESTHCGSCSACRDVCPTQAIVGDRQVDARRCISYLTIEHSGPIPEALRPLMGNRVYGCDDCQLVCPWNKFARRSPVPDFDVRPAFAAPDLLTLWRWDEAMFLKLTEGSPIRRIGFARWQRNIAVALGNALRELEGTGTRPLIVPPPLGTEVQSGADDARVVDRGAPRPAGQGEAGLQRPQEEAWAVQRQQQAAEIRAALTGWLAEPPAGTDAALVGEHVRWALAQGQATAPGALTR